MEKIGQIANVLSKSIMKNINQPIPSFTFTFRLLFCIFLCLLKIQILTAQDYRWSKDSLQRVYHTATLDTVKAKALMDLAGLYAKTNPDTCIQLAKEALQLSQQAKFKRGEVHSINVIGLAYYRKNDYDNALLYYEKVQKNINILAPPPRLGLFLNLGNIYIKRLNYAQALINYQKALKIADFLENKQAIAVCLNNIGNIYEKEKDYIQALKIYEQSLALKEEMKDKKGMAATLNNIGIIYEKQEQLATALSYHQKAIKIFEELKDPQGIAMVMNNIATVDKKQKKNDNALEKYQQGLVLKEKVGDKRGMIYSLNGIAEVLQAQKRYEEGVKTLEKALGIAKEIEALPELNTVYNLLVDNYKAQGDYQKALLYVELAKNTNDSILSIEKAKEIIKLQTAFDVERKELALQKQNIEIQKQEIEIQVLEKENKIQIFALISLAILLIILGLGGYLFYKNRQLKTKFALLESEQRWRRAQMNPHFFFNALSAIQKFVMQADKLQATSYLAKFAKLMRQVLEQSEDEFTPLEEEIETIKNYIDLQLLRLGDKFDYLIEIEENLPVETIKIPTMLLQPIVENAIEHGLQGRTSKGLLKISLKEEAQNLKVEIEDNGVGLAYTVPQKSNHRSFATKIIKERIQLLKAQKGIDVALKVEERQAESGLRVSFTLPIHTQ